MCESLVLVEEGKNKDSVKTAILQIPSLSVSLDSFILALILTQMQLCEQTFGKRRWLMNFKGFSFLHVCDSALKRRALKRNCGPLCTLLLASLMTQFVRLSFFFALSEARKCFLLKRKKKNPLLRTASREQILFYLTIKIKLPGPEFTVPAFPTIHSHTWIMWNSDRRAVNCPSGRRCPLPPEYLPLWERETGEEACWVSLMCPFSKTHTSLLFFKREDVCARPGSHTCTRSPRDVPPPSSTE